MGHEFSDEVETGEASGAIGRGIVVAETRLADPGNRMQGGVAAEVRIGVGAGVEEKGGEFEVGVGGGEDQRGGAGARRATAASGGVSAM